MKVVLRVAAVAAAVCLILTGCDHPLPDKGGGGSSAQKGTGGTGREVEGEGAPKGNGGQAPGAPKPGSGGGLAPGSPMTMPARTQDQGDPLDDKLAYIKSQLAAQCGGSLCVKVDVKYDPPGVNCFYQGSDPEPGSAFYYHKDLIVTVFAYCEEEPNDDGSPGDEQGGDQPGGEQDTAQPSDGRPPGEQNTDEPGDEQSATPDAGSS